jgi:hypothetical protein
MVSWANTWTQIGNVVKAHEVLRSDFESILSTYIATIVSGMSLDTEAAPSATGMAAAFRGGLASMLGPGGVIRSVLDPYVLQLGTLIKSPNRQSGNTSLITAPDLVRYMVDNPDVLVPAPRIQSRQFTRGATSAGVSNIGGGTVVRCLVTADGQPIENTFADTIHFRCDKDVSNGAQKQREGFSVWGQNFVDALDYYQANAGTGLSYLYLDGSGPVITAINSDSAAGAGVQNTSFGQGGAAASTVPPGWTATTSASNFDVVADNSNAAAASRTIYRIADSEASGACSVKIKASDTLTQSLSNVQLSNDAPYYFEIAYNAGIGAGNLTLQIGLGSTTNSVVLTGGAGWHTLRLKIDKGLWLKNFNNGAVALTIAVTAFTSGYVLVDDIRFGSFENVEWNANGSATNGAYDNQWILIVSEAAGTTGQSNFAIGDTFTITDSELGAENQRKFHLGYGATLPCAPPAPGAGLAAALAGAGAGNLSNGVYKYWITKVRFVSESDVNESGVSALATVTVVDHTVDGKASVSGFPVDTDPGIWGYYLYRSQVGGSTGTRVTTIPYASIGTPYVDNSSDASIVGNAAPAGGITIVDP